MKVGQLAIAETHIANCAVNKLHKNMKEIVEINLVLVDPAQVSITETPVLIISLVVVLLRKVLSLYYTVTCSGGVGHGWMKVAFTRDEAIMLA